MTTPQTPHAVALRAVDWPEVGRGDDLAALVAAIPGLADGEIVVLTSKVVSKAEGRGTREDRQAVIGRESRRVVASRGRSVIAETRHGLVLAAAGVDASNVDPGTVLALPLDPDRTARTLREQVLELADLNIGVIVTDTAGRAWRVGQSDLAIGCAGLPPYLDLAGTRDSHGNVLAVTAPAVADELAGAADLVKGKATGRPVAVASGLESLVLPPGEHGPGAAALVRPPAEDLFGLGARDAVAAAVHRDDPAALAHFPARSPDDRDPFDGLLTRWQPPAGPGGITVTLRTDDCPHGPDPVTWTLRVEAGDDATPAGLLAVGRLLERAETLAAASRLLPHDHGGQAVTAGSRPIVMRCWQTR